MDMFGIIICIILLVLIFGIFNIVKGILYYVSAEEVEATVVDSYAVPGDNYGRAYYGLSVDIEDNGKVFTVPVEGRLRLKNIEHALKKGDKITVWYLKNSKKCICDRGQPIKWGLIIIAAVAVAFIPIFFSK